MFAWRETREIEGARRRAQIAVKSSFPSAGSSTWPADPPFFFSTLPSRPARLGSEMKISPRFALASARLDFPRLFSLPERSSIRRNVWDFCKLRKKHPTTLVKLRNTFDNDIQVGLVLLVFMKSSKKCFSRISSLSGRESQSKNSDLGHFSFADVSDTAIYALQPLPSHL